MGVAEPGPQTGHRRSVKDAIGLALEDVATPVLVLDLPTATRNVAMMGERFTELSASLRPHIKAHKCAELAWMQMEHGAIGVTTATVAEAGAMASARILDVLVANQVVAPAWIDRLVEVARRAHVTVAVDDPDNLEELARRARAAGSTLGVVVELDVGMGRGGARSAAAALDLGRVAAELDGVELEACSGTKVIARTRVTRSSERARDPEPHGAAHRRGRSVP